MAGRSTLVAIYLRHRSPRVAAVSERSGAKLQAAEVFGRSSKAASPAVPLLATRGILLLKSGSQDRRQR